MIISGIQNSAKIYFKCTNNSATHFFQCFEIAFTAAFKMTNAPSVRASHSVQRVLYSHSCVKHSSNNNTFFLRCTSALLKVIGWALIDINKTSTDHFLPHNVFSVCSTLVQLRYEGIDLSYSCKWWKIIPGFSRI